MELLPRDVLLMMAIEDMDYRTVLNLCRTSTRYNTILCKNPLLWKTKLQRDYPHIDIQEVTDYSGLYKYLKTEAKVGHSLGNFVDETKTRIKGYRGIYTISNLYQLLKSKLYFPQYSPNLLSKHIKGFMISPEALLEIFSNSNEDERQVTGIFNEKYKVVTGNLMISVRLNGKWIYADWQTIPKGFNGVVGMATFHDGLIHLRELIKI